MQKVVEDIREDAKSIKNSLETSSFAKERADEGGKVVNEITKNINATCDESEKVHREVDQVMSDILKIVESIKLIQEKTQLINDIVFQSKLLSFNASVEAARAGEHGKGFAVVAEEVGNLAAMSGKASIEIHEMIDESVSEVEKIVNKSNKNLKDVLKRSNDKIGLTKNSIEQCRDIFKKIIDNINHVYQEINHVSIRANEKVVVIDEVNDRFVALKSVSEQSSTVAHTVGTLTKKVKKIQTISTKYLKSFLIN